jgi:hypothetical protein
MIDEQNYLFPFGQKLKKVEQTDKSPKKVFVLGVYASAVHAKWKDTSGKVKIKALAVASEPCIFWTGDHNEASKIINTIKIPEGLGTLEPADEMFNGPSGKSLDEDIFTALGWRREDAWLCDLVPYSCQNDSQKKALNRDDSYDTYMKQGKLPQYNIDVPKKITDDRVKEILSELKQSQAGTIILLGDQPIAHFLLKFSKTYQRLSDFPEYGKGVKMVIDNKEYIIIALAHPRQIRKLGKSNKKWYDLHQQWLKNIS